MDNLTDDQRRIVENLNDSVSLLMNAKSGLLSHDEQTHVMEFIGDDAAEALGRAYSTRDAIQEAGYECEATYIGEADDSPDFLEQPLHEVEMRIWKASGATE